MKKTKLLLVMASSFLVLGLAACNNTTSSSSSKSSSAPGSSSSTSSSSSSSSSSFVLPETKSLMDNWAGNLQESYFTTNCTDTLTTLTYKDIPAGDSNNWIYVARSFAFDDNVDKFGGYKTLHFEGQLDLTAGTSNVMLKIQFSEGSHIEKVFNFSAEAKTYELSVASVDWAHVQSILFFPNRTNDSSSGTGSGTIKLTKMSLVKTDINNEYDIDKNTPKYPQAINTYESGDTFAVTKDWRDGGAGVVTPTENAGVWSLAYDKSKATAGTDTSWAWADALVKGEGLSNFKKIIFKVIGTKGNTAIFAMEGLDDSGTKKKTEIKSAITFTGEEQTVEVDLKHLKDGTAVNFDYTSTQMIMIHPDGGSTTGTGTITLNSVTFSKEDIVEDKSSYNIYDGTSDSFALTKGMTALDAGTYAFTYNQDGSIKVDYSVASWKFFKAIAEGENLTTLRTFKIVVKGTAGMTLHVKPFELAEYEIALTGEEQTVEIDISALVAGKTWDATGVHNTLFCIKDHAVTDDTTVSSGSFEIKSMVYTHTGNNVYYSGDSLNITNNWVDGGEGAYTVTRGATAGDFSVAYTKIGEWSTLEAPIINVPTGYTQFKAVIKGTAGDKILAKGSAGGESTITLTGGDDTVEAIINEGASWVGLIADPGTAGSTGSFEIKSATLSKYVDPNINYYTSGDSLDLTAGWKAATDGKYTFAGTIPSMAVTYNKSTGDEWQAMYTKFSGVDATKFTTIEIDITGATAGVSFLGKIESVGSASEVTSTADADGKATLLIPNTVAEGQITIFAAPNVAPASGSFTITKAKIYGAAYTNTNTYISGTRLDITKGWSQADGKLTAAAADADGKIAVTYNKSAGDEWVGISSQFANVPVKTLDRIHVEISGAANGDEYLFKVEGKGDNRVTAGEDGKIVFDIANPIAADTKDGKVTIMPKDGTASISGSFTIDSCYFYDSSLNTYASGSTFSIANSSYKENDTGSYAMVPAEDGSVAITANNDSWKFFYTQIQGAGLSDMTTLTVKVKGEAGKSLLVKPFDKFEKWIDFTDTTEQTVTINLADYSTNLATVDYSAVNKLVFFYMDSAKDGATPVTNATFTITSIVFSK